MIVRMMMTLTFNQKSIHSVSPLVVRKGHKLKLVLTLMFMFFISITNLYAKEKPKLHFKEVKDGVYLVTDMKKCWFHYVVADDIGEAIKKYFNNQSIGFNTEDNESQCKYLKSLMDEA